MRYSKIKGAFKKRFTPQQGGTSHAEKIKNIERTISSGFLKQIFYQGVFHGFSKRK